MTILHGEQTMHELFDLSKALTFQVAQINAAATQAQASPNTWTSGPFATQAVAFLASLAVANVAFSAAATRVSKQLTSTGAVDASGNPTSIADILPALDTDGTDLFALLETTFDPFVDLDRAMMQPAQSGFPQTALPNFHGTPQPTAPDFDLSLYQIADSAVQTVEDAARKVTPYVFGGSVLLLGALVLALYLRPRLS